MRISNTLALVVSGLLTAGAAQAAPAPLYDDFSSLELDATRWSETEMWRYVDNQGRLVMGRYTAGSATSDVGITAENMSLSATRSAPAKSLRATIKVTDISVPQGCASNATQTYAYSRARVVGAFFNIRTPAPVTGDRTGDVVAQIRVGRTSSTTDAPGVLRVQGVLSSCTSADCNLSALMAPVQDLGTTVLGGTVKAQVFWDKNANTFSFVRDAMPAAVVSYTQSDKVPPVVPFNNVSVRNEVPNCLSGPAPKAGIGAMFDLVGIDN